MTARFNMERVLSTSARLFAESGYEGISTRRIALESGCSLPALYYHFGSKQALYAEACDQKLDEIMDIIASRISTGGTSEERLRRLVVGFFEVLTGDRTLMLQLQRHVIDAAKPGRRPLSHRRYLHFSALIRTLCSEVIGRDIGAHTTFAVGGLILGYCGACIVEARANVTKTSEATRRELLVKSVMRLVKDR